MITITDDMDVSCYSLRWNGNQSVIAPVSSEELEALPEWITDTININSICTHNGLMYGPTERSLVEKPLWS